MPNVLGLKAHRLERLSHFSRGMTQRKGSRSSKNHGNQIYYVFAKGRAIICSMKCLTTFLQPRQIKSVTALTASEFETLAGSFNKAWQAAEKARLCLRTGQRRQRALGGGRNAVLRSSRDKLLFILFWFTPILIIVQVKFSVNCSTPTSCAEK